MSDVWVVTIDYEEEGIDIIGVAETLEKGVAFALEDFNRHKMDWHTIGEPVYEDGCCTMEVTVQPNNITAFIYGVSKYEIV